MWRPLSVVADIMRVYAANRMYTTIKLPIDANVAQIVCHYSNKLNLSGDLVLVEVKSNGGV